MFQMVAQTGLGVHLQDLTALGTRTFSEKDLHVIVLEVKAFQLALNAFLLRIIGETLFLMSDSITVLVYFKEERVMVSIDICRLAQEAIAWSELHMVSIIVGCILGNKNIITSQLSHPN